MTPVVPRATTQANDCPIATKVSSSLPVRAMPNTQAAEAAVVAKAYRNAACSGAAISTWYVNQPPLDTAMAARASDESKVPAVDDVARPMEMKNTKPKAKETPMMSLNARDAEMLYVLVNQQNTLPPRTENIIIVTYGAT